MRRRLTFAWAMLLLAPGVTAQTPQRYDAIAAVVNSSVFTLSDVRAVRDLRLLDAAAQGSDAAATMALVERHLVLEGVARFAMPDPSAAAIADRRRQWISTLPSGFNLPAALERHGWTEEMLTTWHRGDVQIEAYLGRLFNASSQPTATEIAARVRERGAALAAGTDGTPQAVEAAARAQLTVEHRQARVREWIESQKRRADMDIKIK